MAIHTRTEQFWESQLSKAMFQSINVWVNVCDADFNILVWNPTAERMSGYQAQEVVGNATIWDKLYPEIDYRDEVLALAADLIVNDTALSHITTQILCKDGSHKHIAWYSRPLTNETSTAPAPGFVTFGYDVTEQKESDDALQKAHDELQVLYQVASITSEYTNLSQICQHSLQHILSITNSPGGIIHVWNPQNNMLEYTVSQGVDTALTQIQPSLEPMFEKDQFNAETLPDQSRLIRVPMFAKGQFQGVISLHVPAGQTLPSDLANVLRSIADQVGIAIDNAYLYQQSKQLAVAEERRRLARDLHDSVTQSLYSLTLFAEAGQRMVQTHEMERLEQYLDRLTTTAQLALKEMRLLLFELRPWDLEPGKLIELIQERLEVVERRSGITAHLMTRNLPTLSPKIEENIYYVVIEALNNALKHAQCDAVSVIMAHKDADVQIEVADNGIGFCIEDTDGHGGMGLRNMRERVQELGGSFAIYTNQTGDEGTVIQANLPLNGKQAK